MSWTGVVAGVSPAEAPVAGVVDCAQRGENRTDDIGSGKLGTRLALEFTDC